MSVKKLTWYFGKPGPENTDKVLKLARKRALELGIKHIVVASTTGETGLKAAKVFADTNTSLVVVPHSFGLREPGKSELNPENRKKLNELAIPVVMATMPLTSPGRFFRKAVGWKRGEYVQYLTFFPTDLIADTLRIFCQGMKVCVEIAVMAADSGVIPIGEDIIAIAGTGRGADTAVVMRAAHMTDIFETKIKEIIAIPRV